MVPKLLRVGVIVAALCSATIGARQALASERTFMCVEYSFEDVEFPARCLQMLAEFAGYWRMIRDEGPISDTPNLPAPRRPQLAPVVITGYSADGERDANNLAFLRAVRVARELVRMGVPEHLIQIHGYADRFLNPGDRRAAENRRVDVVARWWARRLD